MSRALLIVNPSSGREQGEERAAGLTSALRARYEQIEIVQTTGDGDAERAAHDAASRCSAVFVAGGDGTLNEAVNGVASAQALDRVQFGVFPLGTGNDFAAALGIPAELSEAT